MTSFTAELAVNAQVVTGLELRATVQLASGHPDAAAGFLQLAADVASRNHPGWFVSPALEDLVSQLGDLLDADVDGVDPDGPIVHVLAGEAGNLIQDAREWWRHDPTARLVALPNQLEGPLVDAARLRSELAGASMVVLHGPGTAIAPLIAMAKWARRPPLVVVEPDLLGFWAGVGVLDAVVHSSSAAMALAAERRCVASGRSVLVELHERQDAAALFGILVELRARILEWPAPAVPHALLPASPSLIDQRVVSRQVELELTDGVAGALRRWQVPAQITSRPGWVVVGRDSDRVLAILRDLLGDDASLVPDIVLVDVDGAGGLAPLAEELAGVVELIQPSGPVSVDDAARFGARQLVADEILITTEESGVDRELLRELEIFVRSGRPAIAVTGLAQGERCELRRHPRLVGWPTAVPLGHPAAGVPNPDPDPPGGDRTGVREALEITESRGELFHTESEVPTGPSEPTN